MERKGGVLWCFGEEEVLDGLQEVFGGLLIGPVVVGVCVGRKADDRW